MPLQTPPFSGRTPVLVNLVVWGLVVTLGSTLPAPPLVAEELKSADEIVRALSGQGTDEAGEATPRLRGILPTRRSSDAQPGPKIDVTVHFATDSAEIEPRSRGQVEQVARAASRLDLGQARLLIVGHTDSRGPEQYNQVLSLRRAQAVKDALVMEHGLAADTLVAEGRGESELLVRPERGPEDYAKNRRVELRLVREPQPNE